MIEVTPDFLARVAGIALSLIFAYLPWLKDWYDTLESKFKVLVMGAALLVVSLAIYGLTCAGWYDFGITCDQNGIKALAGIFVLALIANQATYLFAVRSFKK